MREKPVKIVAALQALQLRIAMGALLLMMGTTVADVVLRYAFDRPIKGAYDIVGVLLVVFVFHGMTTTFLKRENISIDLIDQFVPARVARLLVRLADAVTVILLVIIAWAMTAPAMQAYDYGDRELELGLPVFVVWIAGLLGIAGTIVCALFVLLQNAVRRRSPQ